MDPDKDIERLRSLKSVIGEVAFSHLVNQSIITMASLAQQVVSYQSVVQQRLVSEIASIGKTPGQEKP